MIGLNPYDHFSPRPSPRDHHAASQPTFRRRPEAPKAEPEITTDQAADAYTIIVEAPPSFELDHPRATLNGAYKMELHGVLRGSALCEYVAVQRTGVYAAPGRQMIGVLPGRSVLRGEAPTRGWVLLEDEEGWVDADDLRMLSRPSAPQRFTRTVELPADALARSATSRVLDDGALHITVPRRETRAPPAPPAPRPRAAETPRAPMRSAPAPAPPPAPSTRPSPARHATAAPAVAAVPASPASARSAASKPKPATRPPAATASAAKPARGHGHHVGGALPASTDGPVLMETESSDDNVQSPKEAVQEWIAHADGGFELSSRY